MNTGELTESRAGLQSQAHEVGGERQKEAICPGVGPGARQQSGEGHCILHH